jgi:hypothetical protein
MAELGRGDVAAEEDAILLDIDLQVLFGDARIVDQLLADVFGQVVGPFGHCP